MGVVKRGSFPRSSQAFIHSFIHSLTVAVGRGIGLDFLFRASLGGAAVLGSWEGGEYMNNNEG